LKYKNDHLNVFLAFIVLFIFFPINAAHADGARLSTIQIGATARLTAVIPQDPCGKHKSGSTSDREVVGFFIDIHPIDDDGVRRTKMGKPLRASIKDATITEVKISGNDKTDFYEDPNNYAPSNWEQFVPMNRDFKFNSSFTFTPNDTASIIVDNVKIFEPGRVTITFALLEPTGVYCLANAKTIVTIGGSTSNTPIPTYTPSTPSPTLIPTTSIESTMIPTVKVLNDKVEIENNLNTENKSIIQTVFNWLKSIFSGKDSNS